MTKLPAIRDYVFGVLHRPRFTCVAASYVDAMFLANQHFGTKPSGSWQKTRMARTYRWVED